jgi:hypothetical protein
MITSYLTQLPMLVVLLVGIVLALVNWGRNPKAASLALFGLVILLAQALIAPAVNNWLPVWLLGRGFGAARIGLFNTIRAAIAATVRAVGYGLLLGAIFSGRKHAEQTVEKGQ